MENNTTWMENTATWMENITTWMENGGRCEVTWILGRILRGGTEKKG
jgi:hypothetical protein